MKIAYFDLISGLSGDMTVGALLDLGLPREKLKRQLDRLPGLRYRLAVGRKNCHGIRAVSFRVRAETNGHARSWAEIRRLVQRCSLEKEVKERGLDIFARLAEVEGKIHGVMAEKVQFHEVGAVDSIVDIMATAVGLHHFGIDCVAVSSVPLGRGLLPGSHGPLPLPAPATLELLKGFPVHGVSLQGETVTPTGAAILSALGARSGDMPPMIVRGVGYGAGEREFPDRPNVLRVLLGEDNPAWGKDEMLVMETNIDDMNPQFYDYLFERLFDAGARDVSLSPIQMKKNRPGILLRIITEPASRDKIAEIVLRETSTIGLRYYPVHRVVLKRALREIKTRFGPVKVKVIDGLGGESRTLPEYDDLKGIARSKKIPLKVVYEEVLNGLARKS